MINTKHQWLFGLSLSLLVFACNKSFQSTEELTAYVKKESSGLQKIKQLGPVEIKLSYRPNDLLVAQELRNQSTTPQLVDSLHHKYDLYAYFLLSLSAGGQEIEAYQAMPAANFGDRIQTLAFGMQEHIQLVTSQQDTVPIADYAYQRTYGVGNSTDLLFAFNRAKINSSDWLQFQLNDFGLGTGKTHFRFKTKDLQNIPRIKFGKIRDN